MHWRLVGLFAFLAILILAFPGGKASAADALPSVQLNADEIAPRPIEELTGRNITRDYAYAWQTLAQALDQNQPQLLDGYFTGFAKTTFTQAIAEQQKSRVRVRYIDRGHKVNAVFYSPNGDAMQLHDTAQLEIQVLDGSKVIQQENVALHYLVIMTPGADRWYVRLLQAVPSF